MEDSAFSNFGPPANMTTREALHAIFSHYCAPFKVSMSSDKEVMVLDSASFVRMCKDAPNLATQKIGRHDFDIVFTMSKPQGIRRLDFEHFCIALLNLSMRKYPDDDPPTAFAKLLTKSIFGLFDQPPINDNLNAVIDEIRTEIMT